MNIPHRRPNRRNPAGGCVRPDGTIETGIKFDAEMFQELRARAVARGTTFSEVVRTYCQWGLDTEADEDKRHRA